MTRAAALTLSAFAVAAWLAAACQQRQAANEEPGGDADTSVALPPAPAAPAPAAAPASSPAELAVTNTMPHEMVVTARWGDPEVERVLGPVGPSEMRTFELEAPAGTTVALIARDTGDTHGVEGNVTASADSAVTWTIQ